MNKNQLDHFYTLYTLFVTIIILAFAWIVFESPYIYGHQNAFASQNQDYKSNQKDSLSETAKEIIDITKNKIKYYKSSQQSSYHIEEI